MHGPQAEPAKTWYPGVVPALFRFKVSIAGLPLTKLGIGASYLHICKTGRRSRARGMADARLVTARCKLSALLGVSLD